MKPVGPDCVDGYVWTETTPIQSTIGLVNICYSQITITFCIVFDVFDIMTDSASQLWPELGMKAVIVTGSSTSSDH